MQCLCFFFGFRHIFGYFCSDHLDVPNLSGINAMLSVLCATLVLQERMPNRNFAI